MAKERRSKEKDVQGSKPITWYATPKDRHSVDDIALTEERTATHIITLAVRAFSQLYKTDPNQALALARAAANQNGARDARQPAGRA